MSEYIDGSGTRILMDSDMNSKDMTEAINSSKAAEEAIKQNKLYEKEIKAIRTGNIINLIGVLGGL